MELTLYRKFKLPKYSIGKLYINGEYFCDTIEDTDRGLYQGMDLNWLLSKKVYCETAIPYGRYRITMDVQSQKFAKKKTYQKCKGFLPRLLNVPAFDGILIHIGNTQYDSCGCLIVGKNTVKGKVTDSTKTFWKLYDKLSEANKKKEEIWITIQP